MSLQSPIFFSNADFRRLFGNVSSNCPEICTGVSTDSRTVESGDVFVALRGDRHDGHDKAAEAIQNGASCCIIEEQRIEQFDHLPHVAVPDTLYALGVLAQDYRKRFDMPIVAIAGAAGKTSTKDIAAYVLEGHFSVLKTHANHNNRIGVPQTIFRLNNSYSAAVIEIGTNEPGEIERLSEILAPTHGLITNIGKEHLEKLVDLDGVEREETALFRYLVENNGLAFVNIDDERLRKYVRQLPRKWTFSAQGSADVYATWSFNSMLQPVMLLVSRGVEQKLTLKIPGLPAVFNAIAAGAVAAELGMSLPEIARRLEQYALEPTKGYGRMSVEHIQGSAILNDCYNANPTSMNIALQSLRRYPAAGSKIAVLGDMKELGASSAEEHDEVLREAINSTDAIIALGEEMHQSAQRISQKSTRIICAQSHSEAGSILADILQTGDVVLLKASRSMTFERILEYLKAAISENTEKQY